jgi:hypothetical protein
MYVFESLFEVRHSRRLISVKLFFDHAVEFRVRGPAFIDSKIRFFAKLAARLGAGFFPLFSGRS